MERCVMSPIVKGLERDTPCVVCAVRMALHRLSVTAETVRRLSLVWTASWRASLGLNV